MVVSKKRKGIIPNETKWPPSRKARELFDGKEYSMRPSANLSTLPSGFCRPSQDVIEEFESLIPNLNGFDASKYMRSVKVQFEFDGSVAVSALKNPGKLKYERKKIAKGIAGGFRRSFDGSAAEVGDIVDGAFKHAFTASSSMADAQRISKFHPVFQLEVVGCCDGMYEGRPIEVKSVSSLSSMNVTNTLARNWFQLAAYNWLYGRSPIIVIVSRDTLEIEIVEVEEDMVEIAMKNWHDWETTSERQVSPAKVPVRSDTVLVK